jgi:hypothetical protein
VREPELQKFWATERIYERLYEEAKVTPLLKLGSP